MCKKFFQWGYVKRHYGSKGIADIVCIRAILPEVPQVVFIQCKYSSRHSAKKSMSKVDKDALINFAKDCGAMPIYAYSENRKIRLINLITNREFKP